MRVTHLLLLTILLIFFFFSPPIFAEEVLNPTFSSEETINSDRQPSRTMSDSEQKNTEQPSLNKEQDNERIQNDIDDLSDRLDEIETKSILDKITLSGEFRTRVDSYSYKNAMFSGAETDGESNEIWSNRLRLNLKSVISDNIIFYGRLTYFKLWGNFTFDRVGSDWSYPSIPDQEGDLHVERAYIDYFVPNTPLSITFGRLPANNGPPTELKNYTTRKSTWPTLTNDIEADGIILNLSLDEWFNLRKSMFRIAYSKFQQNYLRYKETSPDFDDVRAYTMAFECEVPGIKNSLLWFNALTMNLSPLRGVEGIESYPEEIGDSYNFIFHLQFNRIRQTGLDWFVSLAHNRLDTSDTGTLFSNGYEVGLYTDNVAGNLGKTLSGHALYTGFRYQLPLQSLKNPYFGLEYNYGSKHWFGIGSSGDGDLINKTDINGNAYEFYYLQPIHEKTMFLRAGAVHIDYNYFDPVLRFYGNQIESKMTTTNCYLLADIRF